MGYVEPRKKRNKHTDHLFVYLFIYLFIYLFRDIALINAINAVREVAKVCPVFIYLN